MIQLTKEEAQQVLDALEPIALYKAYNGDDWPARQVMPAIKTLRAIADGKEVQFKNQISGAWAETNHVNLNPITHPELEWRVKPEPKPDVVMYARVHEPRKRNIAAYITNAFVNAEAVGQPNLRIYYCGETGKLKKAEVIE